MPIFTRRRLAAMVSELGKKLSDQKRRDLITRLEHKKTDQALAAEAELSLLWALSKIDDIEIEPEFNGRRPEALARNIIPGRVSVIEVTALSDEGMSGEPEMKRAVELLSIVADRARKRARFHLYFRFQEVSGWGAEGHYRRRCITKDFQPNEELKATLTAWIKDWPKSQSYAVRLSSEQIDVVVEYREITYVGHNFFSSMPPVAGSLTDNSLYKALRNKEGQLPAKSNEISPCIFIMDVGSSLLREINNKDVYSYSGRDIINHFLRRSKVEIVAVFSCKRDWSGIAPMLNPLRWTIKFFHQESINADEMIRFLEIASVLPPPRVEGYSARSRHRDGQFDPQASGGWLGTKWTSKHGVMTQIKISSRRLQDFLAGRISAAEFNQGCFDGDVNLFERALASGLTIKSTEVEGCGLDKDDDYIVFNLEFDFSASKIKKEAEKD